MPASFRPTALVSVYFSGLALGSFWLFLAGAGFGMIDDHILFNDAYWVSHFYLPMTPELGRFFPANGLPFSILRKLGWLTPAAASVIMAVRGLATALLGWLLLRSRGLGNAASLCLVTLLLLTPGFSEAFTRKFVSEADMLPLLLAFGLCCGADGFSRVRLAAALALGAALLFYKETFAPALLAVCGFGLCCRPPGDRRRTLLYAGLAASALAWGVLYYVLVYAFKAEMDYAAVHTRSSVAGVVSYYALNDPLLLAGLLWLWVARLRELVASGPSSGPVALPERVRRWRGRITPDDALLLGASVYVLEYVVIGICGTYYLLPAYGLMLPALASNLSRVVLRRGLVTALGCVAVALLSLNMAASTAHVLSRSVYAQLHLQAFGAFLVQHAQVTPARPIRITFLGVPPDGEVAWSVSVLLRHLGLEGVYQPAYQLALTPYRRLYAPDVPPAPPTEGGPAAIPFNVPGPGADLLVVTPYALASGWELARMGQGMNRLFATRSPWFVQEYSVQAFWWKFWDSGMDFPLFVAQREYSGSDFSVFAASRAGEEAFTPFDVSALRLEVEALPPEVAAVRAGTLSVRLGNGSARAWSRERDSQGGSVRVVALLLPRSGGFRLLGSAPMPEVLPPGASCLVQVPIRAPLRSSREVVGFMVAKLSENGVLMMQPEIPLLTTLQISLW